MGDHETSVGYGACRTWRFPRASWALFAALLLAGCDWIARPTMDPRRESNFQDGLRWRDQGRWDNARESFYRALDANPQNLHAHLQLGDLYRSGLSNQVSALHHYNRYLELGRLQNHGEFHDQSVSDGIRNAEIELARHYAGRMLRDQQQFELDSLRRTNAVLQQRLDTLNQQNSILARQLAAATNASYAPPPVPAGDAPSTAHPTNNTPIVVHTPPQGSSRGTPPTPTPSPAVTTRTHRVASGESFAAIARRYNIKPAALQAANPGIDSRRLKPGQTLVIPQR